MIWLCYCYTSEQYENCSMNPLLVYMNSHALFLFQLLFPNIWNHALIMQPIFGMKLLTVSEIKHKQWEMSYIIIQMVRNRQAHSIINFNLSWFNESMATLNWVAGLQKNACLRLRSKLIFIAISRRRTSSPTCFPLISFPRATRGQHQCYIFFS